ncbi:hypothetical protein LOC68_17445 [Blastopirellula sp. JC732]|uniref:PDZ domain-containing protein n=1 Tax=Blastopirellula sediminis TaxID=2894196 RepID=A0A9X1MPR0_9BACT|nr:hypothetical protein [Blastopirellula sediminis]MCC9606520.1 hypothetical protein [Blastopirellula sediminis]MCC9630182.1 hypothetical protein [Blastopirellula sediminis]
MKSRMLLLIPLLTLCLLQNAPAEEHEPEPKGEPANLEAAPKMARMMDSSGVYYSSKLRAQLYLEWMYIRQNGQRVTFWGARIVGMDEGSPLQDLPHVQLGDVITRLDGMRISRSAHWHRVDDGGYYALPEAERHYGDTVVRWIRSGTYTVLNDRVNLGPLGGGPDDGGPVRP